MTYTPTLITDLPWEIIVYIDSFNYAVGTQLFLCDPTPHKKLALPLNPLFEFGLDPNVLPSRYLDLVTDTVSHEWQYSMSDEIFDSNTGLFFGLRGTAILTRLGVKSKLNLEHGLARALKNKNSNIPDKKHMFNVYSTNIKNYYSSTTRSNISPIYCANGNTQSDWIHLSESEIDTWKEQFVASPTLQCTAITKRGHRCKNKINNTNLVFGHTRCHIHSFVFKPKTIMK
tara:strand:- start:446 stop:1132 length:687 start_codon:yes stop_codon:yes gene_type:complete